MFRTLLNWLLKRVEKINDGYDLLNQFISIL